MDMYSLIIILCIAMIALQFWRLRGISEYTIKYAEQYCKKEGLQYISLARNKTRISIERGKPDWLIEYDLEFSSDGETQYIGTITSHGKRIMRVDLPVFRMASSEYTH
jgi:GNAT superfamily N-acetyltransferase